MNNENIISIIMGCVTAYLAVLNFVLQSRGATKNESRSITTVEVKLDQLLDAVGELKKELADYKADMEHIKERVIKLETRLEQITKE